MSNTFWLIIGVAIIALIAVVGVYLYQKSKNEAEAINQQKLQVLTASLGGTLQQGQQSAGFGGWIKDLLGSSSVTALASGFGSSYGSSLGQNTGGTKTSTTGVKK